MKQILDFKVGLQQPLEHHYVPGKWSIAQMFMNKLDMERVFHYRAWRFLGGDNTPLTGFDKDEFVGALGDLVPIAIGIAKADLKQLFAITRTLTIDIFKNASSDQLQFKGNASGKNITARVIPFFHSWIQQTS
ncbi:hypothetical protein BST97_02000 [Nonlabens spongiae]|uniref:Uncharacterized protein n=1 Tax=Nonlabens spongiae TaxID=331648 RepID=A0A1W6MH10_9FLAO|nr:hypothetical protein [Nonlabens spongiae]ARN76870.1 hypothetical protein BST97_02000 [Nonlabens spongiae]